MTTIAIYSTSYAITSSSATYATAAAGSGSFQYADHQGMIMQQYQGGTYYITEPLELFDTSVLDGVQIDYAYLQIMPETGSIFGSNWNTVYVKAVDVGGTLDSGDWKTPTQLSALTTVGSAARLSFNSDEYNSIQINNAALNVTGRTDLTLYEDALGAAPSAANEGVWYYPSQIVGTDADPYLLVGYTLINPVLYVSVVASDNTTALTDELAVDDGAGHTFTGVRKLDLKLTPVANKTKSDWDGARLKLRWAAGGSQVMRVREAALDYTYAEGAAFTGADLKIKDLTHHSWEDALTVRVLCPVHHTWEAPLGAWVKYNGSWLPVNLP